MERQDLDGQEALAELWATSFQIGLECRGQIAEHDACSVRWKIGLCDYGSPLARPPIRFG